MAIDNSFLQVLQRLDSFFELKGLNYCIVGGLAVCFRGEIRATMDIDISLHVDLGTEEEIVKLLLNEFQGRYEDSRDIAEKHKVLFLEIDRIPVDILLGFSVLDSQTITNATSVKFSEDLSFPVCTAQDLIIHKCLAGTDKDSADIQSILIRSSNNVSINYVEQILQEAQLVIEDRDLLVEFRNQLKKIGL